MDALDYIMEAEARGLIGNDPPPLAKGQCRACGKIIGRGIWRHTKSCKAKQWQRA